MFVMFMFTWISLWGHTMTAGQWRRDRNKVIINLLLLKPTELVWTSLANILRLAPVYAGWRRVSSIRWRRRKSRTDLPTPSWWVFWPGPRSLSARGTGGLSVTLWSSRCRPCRGHTAGSDKQWGQFVLEIHTGCPPKKGHVGSRFIERP